MTLSPTHLGPRVLASLSLPPSNNSGVEAASPAETPNTPAGDVPQAANAVQSAFSTTNTLPPIRIVIAKIDVNARVQESEIETWSNAQGQIGLRWADPGRAVGHLSGTGMPGQADNMVFTGHNNWLGEVFRRLPELKRGDEIIVYTDQAEHRYQVDERWIVPYRRDPERGHARLKGYVAQTEDERLTLISCYPYVTNADRIVVIARPVTEPAQATQGEQ
jgi:sortase A